MSYGCDASKQYLRNTILTASPEQLHLMLLDGAIRFATRGLEGIQARNVEEMFDGLERAQRIVLELSAGLRREANPELADRLAGLYGFIYRRLVEANLNRDAQAVEDALRILRHQRETWALVLNKLAQETCPGGEPSQALVGPTDGDHTSRFVAEG